MVSLAEQSLSMVRGLDNVCSAVPYILWPNLSQMTLVNAWSEYLQ